MHMSYVAYGRPLTYSFVFIKVHHACMNYAPLLDVQDSPLEAGR